MNTCACGCQAKVIRYVDGKKTCDRCKPVNRSGTFLRHLEGEAREYDRDIVQAVNKDGSINENFVELYGREKAEKVIKDHATRRTA
jgi:hypothetical protein